MVHRCSKWITSSSLSEVVQYSSSSWSSSSNILLHFHSSMSSLLPASLWFINDKACQCALPLCCCFKHKKSSQWYYDGACHDRYYVHVNECVALNAHEVSSWRANLYTSSFYESPWLQCHCSPWTSQIFLASTPSPFHLFMCFPIPFEPLVLPPTLKTSLCIHSTWAMDSNINHSTYMCWDNNLLG